MADPETPAEDQTAEQPGPNGAEPAESADLAGAAKGAPTDAPGGQAESASIETAADFETVDQTSAEKTSPGETSQPEVAEDAPASDEPTPSPGPTLDQLPAYTRSLLKIPVSVSVTLASKKAALSQIVGLAPGSILQFDKSCEDLLELCVGGRAVADGEAVKVGEKFGLRINSITLPKERFHRVAARRDPEGRNEKNGIV